MGWTLAFFICLVVAVHSLSELDIREVFGIGDIPQTHSPTQDEGIITVCAQENGQPGECVPYYLCSANNSIITDGVDELDIRQWRINSSKETERVNEEYQCTDYIEICCGNPDILNIPILPPATPRLTSTTGISIFLLDGERGVDFGSSEYVKPTISGCGQRNPDGVGFRIKGDTDNEAEFGEFPWMVAILMYEKELNLYICGGSLIHPKVVMTSAHCVAARSVMPKLKIRAGEWDTQTKREIFPHQDRNVVQIMSHEQYNPGNLHNDIALLILESPITYAENIGVVCLPPENEEPPLNAKCYATGWGKDVFGKGGKNPIILKRISSTIIPRNKCQANLKTRLGNKFTLHRTFICADGEKGIDTCRGDGGSPLVCPMPGYPGKFMQSGIVAWGIGCGKGNTPGVYVHIASLRSWIEDQLYFNNINDMNLYAP